MLFLFILCGFIASSGGELAAIESMNAAAERYVHLVLALGQHDSDYVDARQRDGVEMGVRASYRQSFRLDYRNLEEQLNDGKIANVSLPEIKTAIEQLSFEERAELAAWLHGWNDDEWDEQMKRDIGSGKLDDVLHEVEEDIKSGRTREMP